MDYIYVQGIMFYNVWWFYCYMCQVFKLKLVNIWQSVTCSGAIVAVTW